ADLAELEDRAAAVVKHAGAAGGPADTVAMAARLARWLAAAPADRPESFAAAAQGYVDEGGWVDRARQALRDGSPEPELETALRELLAAADARRAGEDAHFADVLRIWTASGAPDERVLGVEDVLPRVVAPLAATTGVLVIVMDGLSHAIASELVRDLSWREGWVPCAPAARPQPYVVCSTLPSVTRLSRASLLAGERVGGLARGETATFAAQVGLGDAPRLFHKGDLRGEGGGLADAVRAELAGSRRVVGAVLNAIDDHLARGDQLRPDWRLEAVAPLRALLEAARDAGRVVVLASDHGHVLERGGEQRPAASEGGERWRSARETPAEGEVLLEGPRVLVDGGRALLAWREDLRYGPRKHGYHGGANPQEVVCPLFVLAPGGEAPEGFADVALTPPAWWSVQPAPAARPGADRGPEPADAIGQLALTVEQAPAPARPDWLEAWLASEEFAAQRRGHARVQLDDARIAALLAALDTAGPVGREALAREVGMAPTRLDGALSVLRRLVNLDGYPVLSIDRDADEVTLDVGLLREQFGL
ncbi:MAG: BREX-2 system phosphatase PglZ, partial [Actinobacteria bacterium]|nr:BREX-2 system phosphatase PglZ [Actinomycetota bacterium]